MSKTDIYKGICAVLIFFHHMTQKVDAEIFRNFGYLAVAGFFFVAGYGMSCSWKMKPKYEKEIIKKKIPKLLMMCFLTIGFSLLFYTIMRDPVNVADLVGIIRGNRLLNWYFSATIGVYLIFACAAVLSKERKENLVLNVFVLITIYTGILYILVHKGYIGIHWIMSLYAFLGVLGCFIQSSRKNSRLSIKEKTSGFANKCRDNFVSIHTLLFRFTGTYVVDVSCGWVLG